jgi:hypothetical protein
MINVQLQRFNKLLQNIRKRVLTEGNNLGRRASNIRAEENLRKFNIIKIRPVLYKLKAK